MLKKKKEIPGELIYGVHPVIELLKAKRRKIFAIYTTKPLPKVWKKIESCLPVYPVQIQYVTRDILTNMVGTHEHQSIVAWVQPFPFRHKAFDPKLHPFLVMLDSIQDGRNVGAIIRSAYCAGAQGIIMTIKNSAPLSAVALKAAAGLAERLEIQQVSSGAEALFSLKEAGYNNYLAMLKGENALQTSFKLPLCLVIGNEAVGISESLTQYGRMVTLPQKKADVSYNASVAAGILCFMIGTQHNLL